MSYSAAKRTADALAQTMTNPRELAVCPVCLMEFAYRLHQDLLEHLPRLRLECHAFFDACLAILLANLPPEELSRIPGRLSMNRRRCHISNHMSYATLSADEWKHVLLESTGHVFKITVQLGAHSFADRVEKAGKSFADKLGRWPASVEQLFPLGAPAAVDALLSYCELYVAEGPMDTLSAMLFIARPAILPVFMSEPSRARLIGVVLRMLEPAKHGLAGGSRYTSLHNPYHIIESAKHMLEVLRSGPGSIRHEGIHVFAGREEAIFDILCPLIERTDSSDGLFGQLCSWCSDAGRRCGREVPPRVREWLDDYLGPDRTTIKTLAHNVHYFARVLMTSRVCAGPGCSLSTLQTEGGKPFPACARCKVPRYCSRACQRADWTAGGTSGPHKPLCRVFCKLNAADCTPGNLRDFEGVLERTFVEFDAADRAALKGIATVLCDHPGCREKRRAERHPMTSEYP